jgi:competence protein ComFA
MMGTSGKGMGSAVGLFSLYLAQGVRRGLLYLSPEPSFDLAFLRAMGIDQMELLTPPLPSGIAAYLLTNIKGEYGTAAGSLLELPEPWLIRQFCLRKIQSLDYHFRDPAEWTGADTFKVPDPAGYSDCGRQRELEMLLEGKLLSLQEIARLAGFPGERGIKSLQLVLQELCLTGRVVLIPALFPLKGSLVRCQRCGWEGIPEPRTCQKCGSSFCCICPECRLLGPLSLCETLYTARKKWGDDQVKQTKSYRDRLMNLFGFVKRGHPVEQQVGCFPLVCGNILPGASASQKDYSQQERVELPRTFHMEVQFTPPQRAAARALHDFGAHAAPGSSCLVWAACGAGKTEVSFPLIGQALNRGDNVLFATPRRDVVLEIAPRLARVFGKGVVVPLYGGSGNLGQEAPLVVATTHQTLRFYHKFDLVILDEGDAFPYPGSRMLHFGVERALRPGGKLVYLTATPVSWMFERTKKDRVNIIKIPARPHGFPLPEPRFLNIKPFYNEKGATLIHRKILALIASLLEETGARLFLFVPSVSLTGIAADALRAAAGKPPLENLRQDGVEWSHAGDRQRDQKRERFFDGDFPIFVTTTIMERGVTVPHLHVLVLDADQEMVFNTPTLVQIAGRCGRSPEYPTGEVWFVASQITRSMREARAQIRSFNEEARRKGYLNPDVLTCS